MADVLLGCEDSRIASHSTASGAQACFVNRVIKSKERTNRKSAKSKRGWFTKEAMVKNLGWSSPPGTNMKKHDLVLNGKALGSEMRVTES